MLPVDKYDLYQNYIIDNPYPHPKTVVEDVKSPVTKTDKYIIKRKLLLKLYGIRIREV